LKDFVLNAPSVTLQVKANTARAYPSHLITQKTLPDGTVLTIRPIRPADRNLEEAFVKKLSDYSRYYRFMHAIRELSPAMLEHFTHPDYDREMAFIALATEDATEEEIGVARYLKYPDGRQCEFALAIADAWQGRGVGTALLQELMANARSIGLESMEGFVLSTNQPMLKLVKFLGFSSEFSKDDPTRVTVRKDLQALA
jgi:acetyltransferase